MKFSSRRREEERLLLAGRKVEVRSTEDGFQGSWHPATVIDSDMDLVLRVMYDHILVEQDSKQHLCESISVPCTIDGLVPTRLDHHRGIIRPLHPQSLLNINLGALSYGLCVDALLNDAWWEGVIFDFQDCSDKRLVFFPDIGDQGEYEIENLRITHDWCEIAQTWSPRGDWLFLQLLEECEENSLSPGGAADASFVQQLWKNVRDKQAYKDAIKEWTCWSEKLRPIWDQCLEEALGFGRAVTPVMRSDSKEEREPAGNFPEAVIEISKLEPRSTNVTPDMRSKARRHLKGKGWVFWHKMKAGREELRYTSPSKKVYYSLRTACQRYIEEEERGGLKKRLIGSGCEGKTVPSSSSLMVEKRCPLQQKRKTKRYEADEDWNPEPNKKRKSLIARSRTLTTSVKGDDSKRSSGAKRIRHVVETNMAQHCVSQSILSWLVDNNVVVPKEKVYCNTRTPRGKVTRDGIKCQCCQKTFSVSSFGTHINAACTTQVAAVANIFLKDGRSLLQCQQQLHMMQQTTEYEQRKRIKSSLPSQEEEDLICSVCHYGGELVLCDQCPSTFHMSCIGLDELPEGEWFCYSCRCGVCGKSDFYEKAVEEQFVLDCSQCERKFHLGCSKRNREGGGESWFCSVKCEKIFGDLHQLVGKPIPVGDGLSWTMLKGSSRCDSETAAEQHSKLNVALAVMHECFEPVKEAQTKDLVRDVIFNEGSTLKRLDFRGFFTIVLEKEDEMVSVATVRVYGDNVAEVPLVGTRVRYRKQGMCRVLMDMLEKKLTEFGVEKLILPAASQVLRSWTTSFGFSQMTRPQRLTLVHHIFLEFQDTTMCQKHLLPRIAAAAGGGGDDCGVGKQSPPPLEKDVEMVSAEQCLKPQGNQDNNASLKVYSRRKKKSMPQSSLA